MGCSPHWRRCAPRLVRGPSRPRLAATAPRALDRGGRARLVGAHGTVRRPRRRGSPRESGFHRDQVGPAARHAVEGPDRRGLGVPACARDGRGTNGFGGRCLVWLALHKTGWLAWGLWLLTVALALASGVLVLLSPPEARGQDFRGLPDLVLALPFIVGSATVGAMVGARRPGNPVGWLLGICGLLVGLDEFARAYAIYGVFLRPGSLPAAALAAWLNAWTWQLTFGLMLTLVPLIFPTGHPPSSRWRPLVWLVCAFITAWTLSAALGPGTIKLDWRSGYTLPNPLGQPSPVGWWLLLAGERAGPPMALAALFGAGALLTRLIRARGEERRQLKWIAFAA